MDIPLWVPWVLTVALALPVAVRSPHTPVGRQRLAVLLSPALAMALVAAWLTVDRLQVTEDELGTAAREAAASLDGSLGSVNAERVASLVAAEIGQEVWVERTELVVQDDLNATYSIEVRVDRDEASHAACIDVGLEVLDAQASDLRLATVEARSGGCDGS